MSVHNGETGMTDKERMLRLATADAATLARVDEVLTGTSANAGSSRRTLELLTMTEAARRMNLSRVTVYRMVRKGVLQTVQLNGINRVKLQSMIDFLDGRSV